MSLSVFRGAFIPGFREFLNVTGCLASLALTPTPSLLGLLQSQGKPPNIALLRSPMGPDSSLPSSSQLWELRPGGCTFPSLPLSLSPLRCQNPQKTGAGGSRRPSHCHGPPPRKEGKPRPAAAPQWYAVVRKSPADRTLDAALPSPPRSPGTLQRCAPTPAQLVAPGSHMLLAPDRAGLPRLLPTPGQTL